jgi:CheY-like chemotaxis protein
MSARRVIAVTSDLFFVARIDAVAKAAGAQLTHVSAGQALAAARSGRVDLVILDLHAPGDPLAVARALKANPETAGISIVGFYSHVDQALRKAAIAAGVDRPMPRSAFTAKLPELLGASSS